MKSMSGHGCHLSFWQQGCPEYVATSQEGNSETGNSRHAVAAMYSHFGSQIEHNSSERRGTGFHKMSSIFPHQQIEITHQYFTLLSTKKEGEGKRTFKILMHGLSSRVSCKAQTETYWDIKYGKAYIRTNKSTYRKDILHSLPK